MGMYPDEPQLTLALLTRELREPLLDMIADFRAAGEDRYDWIDEQFGRDFDGLLLLLDKQRRGIDLPAEHVPQTTFFLMNDQQRILGGCRLRHGLHPRLREWGGNIGYDIRPCERRKGYGTVQLSLALEKARSVGLMRAMLTCDATNLPSIKVITSNGGQFDDEYYLRRIDARVRRYWIEL
ncbi:MAG TPA: GNAT family N-acetyltransferase [Tepidisphaeraceae bacterium]|jgi:predicted acetyltransferase